MPIPADTFEKSIEPFGSIKQTSTCLIDLHMCALTHLCYSLYHRGGASQLQNLIPYCSIFLLHLSFYSKCEHKNIRRQFRFHFQVLITNGRRLRQLCNQNNWSMIPSRFRIHMCCISACGSSQKSSKAQCWNTFEMIPTLSFSLLALQDSSYPPKSQTSKTFLLKYHAVFVWELLCISVFWTH